MREYEKYRIIMTFPDFQIINTKKSSQSNSSSTSFRKPASGGLRKSKASNSLNIGSSGNKGNKHLLALINSIKQRMKIKFASNTNDILKLMCFRYRRV